MGPGVDVYYSYTHALRHPVIIGHIAGWRLPWAVSATQLGAVAATTAVLLVARGVWAHLGGVGNLIVFCLVVGFVGWAVRFWRVEGRSPVRAAAGMANVMLGPVSRVGVYGNGRPARRFRPVRSPGIPIPVVADPERGVGDG
jgi:hypothetical protein